MVVPPFPELPSLSGDNSYYAID